MSNMQVARTPKIRNYTCSDNEHTFDLQLSGLASRIMSMILALKDTWEFSMRGLYSMCKEGQKAVQNAFNELVQNGYVVRRQLKDEHTKRWGKMMYYFYESPTLNPDFVHPEQEHKQLSLFEETPKPWFEDTPEMACQAAWQEPPSGKEALSNTYSSNTLIPVKSVSPAFNCHAENSVENQKTDRPSRKPMPFSEMLYNMGSPLCEYGFQNEQELSDFENCDDRSVQDCRIPYFFKHNQETMENALKYLLCYSAMEDGEDKNFISAVAGCLAEAVCTGKASFTEFINPERLIDEINAINASENDSLIEWADAFARHYSRKLTEKQAAGVKIRNKHGFLKTLAVNHLLKDYKSNSIPPDFRS